MSELDDLLVVQEHDSAADHLRHRRINLPEREALVTAERELRHLTPALEEARARRDAVTREVKRLEDESAAITARVAEVEKTLYSGSTTSPRELQAMQADIEQLQRHRDAIDDQELTSLEQQEKLDTEVHDLEATYNATVATRDGAGTRLVDQEREIDAELASEQSARDAAAAGIAPGLLNDYERAREQARGVGAARLIGNTCQGCRLTIPATEVERIKKADPGSATAHCDNCGAILVP